MRVFSSALLSVVFGELETGRTDERGHPARPEGLDMDPTWAEDGAEEMVFDQAHPQSVGSDTTLKRHRSGSVVGRV